MAGTPRSAASKQAAHGARAPDVVREVRARVDAAQHEVDAARPEETVEGDEHAVRRRAVDREASLAARLDLHVLPPAQRPPAPALVLGRSDHPHVVAALPRRAFQHRQSVGVDSVVVDDDDSAFSNAHGALCIPDSTGTGLYTQSLSGFRDGNAAGETKRESLGVRGREDRSVAVRTASTRRRRFAKRPGKRPANVNGRFHRATDAAIRRRGG